VNRSQRLGTALLVAPLLAGPSLAEVAERQEQELSADLRVERVAPGVWRHVSVRTMDEFGPVPANGLIVVGEQTAALIDTPWTDEQTALLFDFVQRQFGVKIAHVVATHSHGDCMGGLAEAHERGAVSYASELTAKLAREAGDPVPQRTFTESSRLPLRGVEVELYYFGGGHTRDNIVAWIPRREVLFGGCLVKRKGGSRGYIAEADLKAWPETLRKLQAAFPQASIVVPGHGPPGSLDYLDYTIELVEGLDD
jgi:metallo-beta-lactamase class B